MPAVEGVRSVSIGVLAGGFSGLTGVGGGSIMVPLMTGQLRLTQHRAHGTSLAVIMFGAIAGAIGYWRAGNIDWQLVLALTPGAVLGVYAGARAMARMPEPQLRMLFAAFLLFVAFRQLAWELEAGAPRSGMEGLLIEALFGFAGGVLAGVLGVGGGAIFVPAMVIFGLTGSGDDAQKVAQGVSLVVIIMTGVVGTATHWRQDNIDAAVVARVAPAAVIAAFIASLFANAADAALLTRIYGIVALLLGIEMMWTAVRALRRTSMREV